MSSVAIRRRNNKRRVSSPAFNRSQVIRTDQVVTPTGADIAIRPPRTALRRMDTRGAGTVGTF